MGKDKSGNRFFFNGILVCTVFSTILTIVVLGYVKRNLLQELNGMEFIIESNDSFDSELFYTYDIDFSPSQKIQNSGLYMDTLVFSLPSNKEIIKKFRLDFGENQKIQKVKIKELRLLFREYEVVLDDREIFSSLFSNSTSVFLDKDSREIVFNRTSVPFDPYIIFSPLSELVLESKIKTFLIMALILPFTIFFTFYFLLYVKKTQLKILDILLFLFIVCIPLKIAWTTFITLLLCLYGFLIAIKRGKIVYKTPIFFGFLLMFSLLVLFGRPLSFSSIDKQLSLLLFAFVSITVWIPKFKIYKYYIFSFASLYAIMLASGLSFLFFFKDFYALDIGDYFKEIKSYNGNIRRWLYYDHAAFLSFFGLAGMILAQELLNKRKMDKKWVYVYNLLLILFIILSGSRVSLLIYGVLLFNSLIKLDLKYRIFANMSIYVIFAFTLTLYIKTIDTIRYHLWFVSWEAIKKKPLFGYGLGQSKRVLQSTYFNDRPVSSTLPELNHSHNQFLTFFIEVGFIGFFVLSGIFALFLYRTKLYKSTSMVLFLFSLGYVFLTESILNTSKPLYVLCFLFLILAYQDFKKVEPEN